MSSKRGARQLGLALLCATFGVGCAGLIEMVWYVHVSFSC